MVEQNETTLDKSIISLIDNGNIQAVIKQEKFNTLLNAQPPIKWLKRNDQIRGKDSYYLPIDKIETMLDTFFPENRIEIKSIAQMANAIVAVVRVHYKNPVVGEWTYQDGTGAMALQTEKDHLASDMVHIKSNAVQLAAPAAVSYAIKDAAEHIGKIFGRDLKRSDTEDFQIMYTEAMNKQQQSFKSEISVDKAISLANLYVDREGLDFISALAKVRDIPTKEEVNYEIKRLVNDDPVFKDAKAELERALKAVRREMPKDAFITQEGGQDESN